MFNLSEHAEHASQTYRFRNLYSKAKCLSDEVSAKSSSRSVLKESVQGICAPADLDSECETAAVEAAFNKIIQSIELQYNIMQKRHANMQTCKH